jgi:hypothetical protein
MPGKAQQCLKPDFYSGRCGRTKIVEYNIPILLIERIVTVLHLQNTQHGLKNNRNTLKNGICPILLVGKSQKIVCPKLKWKTHLHKISDTPLFLPYEQSVHLKVLFTSRL